MLLRLLLSLAALTLDGEHVWLGRYPLHVILLVPLDQVDAFKHVGDIVDAALLHLELLHGLIQVELLVRLRPEQVDELIRQLDEPIFLARSEVLYGEGPERRGLRLYCVRRQLLLSRAPPLHTDFRRHHIRLLQRAAKWEVARAGPWLAVGIGSTLGPGPAVLGRSELLLLVLRQITGKVLPHFKGALLASHRLSVDAAETAFTGVVSCGRSVAFLAQLLVLSVSADFLVSCAQIFA